MIVNYTQLIGIGAAVTDHYWSLCVEEHSYLLLALLAFVFRRAGADGGKRPAAVIGAIAIVMMLNGWRLWMAHPDYYAVYWLSDVRAAALFASVALRMVWINGGIRVLKAPWVAAATFAAAVLFNLNHVPAPSNTRPAR